MDEFTVKAEEWSKSESTLLKALGAAGFAFLTILSAQIRIPLPFTPIPMTLQTFVVPLSGGFLGAFWGGASMLLYLALGILGISVFAAAGTGVAFFLAPSAGYAIGFFFAAVLVGWVRDRFRSNRSLLLALILSHIVIFACGVLGLMINAQMNLHDSLTKGATPFLIGDSLKLVASFLVLVSYKQLRGSAHS